MSGLTIDIRGKDYPGVGRAMPKAVLRDIDVSIAQGEFVCILGASGAGKTTLLNIVAGLDQGFEGGLTLPASPGRAEPVIGYVFQEPRLLPWLTVLENIELVLTPEQARSGQVDDLLAATGLEDSRHVYPQRLSLGMGRRVALVRAFAVQPDLLLMDEPFASLDEPTAQRLRRLLLRIWTARPTTVLFVTHDIREAAILGDRILLLAGAPSSIAAEVPVDVPREQRTEPPVVEDFRARLIREHPALFGDL